MKNFLKNKYTNWYFQIVQKAKTRQTLDGYTERHHIIPRSMGGSDDNDNLVELTAREHFVCHWLLSKMTEGDDRYKMLSAIRMMHQTENTENQCRYHTKITSRVFENIRQEWSAGHSIAMSGENNPAKRDEVRETIRKQKTGVKRAEFSDEWRQNLSKNHKSTKGYDCSLSEETKRKISATMSGRTLSETHKKRIGESQLGRKRSEETKRKISEGRRAYFAKKRSEKESGSSERTD